MPPRTRDCEIDARLGHERWPGHRDGGRAHRDESRASAGDEDLAEARADREPESAVRIVPIVGLLVVVDRDPVEADAQDAGAARDDRTVDLDRDAGGNLTGATIEGEAVLDAVALFGGVDVEVPTGWRVVLDGPAIFGGNDSHVPPPVENDAPTLHVRGTAIFGGVDVKLGAPTRTSPTAVAPG